MKSMSVVIYDKDNPDPHVTIKTLRTRIAALEAAGDAMADLLYPEETAKAWRKLREGAPQPQEDEGDGDLQSR